jgi:hypothetical protein
VQIITIIATSYVVADKLLLERHPTLFWIPCTAHCIDLMLEDVGKISFIMESIDQARSIKKFICNHAFVLSLMNRFTRKKFIYNHAFVLSLMNRFTRNMELLHLTFTSFANNFISL